MLGDSSFFRGGVIAACVAVGVAHAAPSAQQRMYDRLQQQQGLRQQQQLDDMQLPGDGSPMPVPLPAHPADPGRCFSIDTITLKTLDGEASPFGGWLLQTAQRPQGRCMTLQDIRILQAVLSNTLIDRGFITSRVLIPEQDVASGSLELLVVPGRIESFEAAGMSTRILEWAVPARAGDLLNLRDLEHAVESLARLPHLDARMDLAPGEEQGGTVILGQAEWPRRYRGTLVIDEEHYGDITHGTAQAGFDWGHVTGVPDRLSLSLNTDLDTEFSDQAWGAGLSYDISYGYWNLAMSYNRQEYQNTIDGVFQDFASSGATGTSRLELTRTLYRSNRARFSFSLLGAYSDTENLLEDAVIRVSSYHLRAWGGRANGKYLWGNTLLAGTFTVEQGRGAGPATRLPGDVSIADISHRRYQAFLTANHFIKPLYSNLSIRINGQYSTDALFPSERFSVASSAAVRGYRDVSLNGNSAMAGAVQLDVYPPITGPVSFTPYVAYDSGLVPGNRNETGFARIDSSTIGLRLGFRRLRLTTEVSWPMEQHSTEMTDSEYTLHASLYAEL